MKLKLKGKEEEVEKALTRRVSHKRCRKKTTSRLHTLWRSRRSSLGIFIAI